MKVDLFCRAVGLLLPEFTGGSERFFSSTYLRQKCDAYLHFTVVLKAAASLLNFAGGNAQFARSRCAILGGILRLPERKGIFMDMVYPMLEIP